MTIHDIKRIHESKDKETYFFSPKTMRFFHQTLKSFSIRKLEGNLYFLSAPMKDHSGKRMGTTERYFYPETGELLLQKKEVSL
jgi:hypothetical protein